MVKTMDKSVKFMNMFKILLKILDSNTTADSMVLYPSWMLYFAKYFPLYNKLKKLPGKNCVMPFFCSTSIKPLSKSEICETGTVVPLKSALIILGSASHSGSTRLICNKL